MEREEIKERFGKSLREFRISQGVTKAELSRKTGFSVRAIEYWESGERKVKLENLILALTALGYDVDITVKEKE